MWVCRLSGHRSPKRRRGRRGFRDYLTRCRVSVPMRVRVGKLQQDLCAGPKYTQIALLCKVIDRTQVKSVAKIMKASQTAVCWKPAPRWWVTIAGNVLTWSHRASWRWILKEPNILQGKWRWYILVFCSILHDAKLYFSDKPDCFSRPLTVFFPMLICSRRLSFVNDVELSVPNVSHPIPWA